MEQDNTLTVLVVEDEPDMASVLKILLERKFSATVEIAEDCASARKRISSGTFDIITLDYQLPDGDGLELLREVNEMDDPPLVIMVTGHGDEQTAVESFKLGANGYVVKGKRLSALLPDAVRHALSELRLRRAEEVLKFEQEQLLSVFESIDEVIYVVDPESHEILYANKHLKDSFGRELVGGICYRELQDLDEPCDFCTDEIIFGNKGEPYTWEYHNTVLDRDYLITDRVMKWPDGRDVRFEIAIDITERKRAERELRESEEKYRLLAENATDVIWAMDINLNWIYASPSIERLRGYTPEEAMSLTLEETMTPESFKYVMDVIAEELEADKEKDPDRVKTIRVEQYCKDGSTVWVSVSTRFLRDEDGDVIGILGIASDITDRKRMEESLKESEESLKTIFDSVPALIFYKDRKNKFISINKSTADSMGLPAGEIEGKSLFDFFPREQAEAYWKDDLEVIESGVPKMGIIEPMETSEGARWLKTDKIPYKDAEGDTVGIIGFAVDIIGQREAEKSIRESEDKYRELAESLPQVVFEMDFAGSITYANEVAFEMFGYTHDDLGSVNALELIEDVDKERVAGAVMKMMDGRSDGAIREYIARRKDGTTFPVRAYTSLIVDDEDNRVGIRGMLTDITEEKEAERIIRESEQKYRDLFENASDLIQSVDTEGKFVYVNNAWRDTMGYTEEEVRELTLGDTICPDCMEHCMETFREVIDGKEVVGVEAQFVTKDGRLVDVEGNINCHMENGTPVATRGMFRDITERKKAEDEIRRINAELKGYANTVSHDLKSPLTSVSMGCEMLASDLMSEPFTEEKIRDIKETVDIIQKGNEKANRLVGDLLVLAKSGQVPGETSTVDVGEIVEEILGERSNVIKEKGIKVDVSGDLGTITASPTQIKQVFSNLVGNAFTHNDSENPVIWISHLGDDGGGGHRYLVRDNGTGIPEEIIDNVFLPFTRGKGGDTGIGLSIVEKLVKVYGGEIRAYNDNGACFEFTLRDF